MKTILAAFLFISIQALALAPDEHEINRRNFFSLNTDLNEVKLIVHYPGGSSITEVCGLKLQTNIVVFSNSHMEAFIKEIEIREENGNELVAVQSVTEPPYFPLTAVDGMQVPYRLRTKSGDSLRNVIRKAALSENLKFGGEPEIIVVARHCKDKS